MYYKIVHPLLLMRLLSTIEKQIRDLVKSRTYFLTNTY